MMEEKKKAQSDIDTAEVKQFDEPGLRREDSNPIEQIV